MSIVCPHCNAIVLENAIHYPTKTARCSHCDYEFSVARLLQNDEDRKKVEMVYDIPKPARINQYVDGNMLVITRTWERGQGLFMLLLSIPFLIASIAIFGAFLSGTWLVIIHLIVFPIATGFQIRMGLQNFLNVTTIQIDPLDITVQHAPIPAFVSAFGSQDIIQVYVKREYYSKREVFDVKLVMETGQHQTLIKHLPNSVQALYIEQEIEKFLGIVDAPVRGEYGSHVGLLSRLANVFSPKPQTKYKF